MSLAISKDGLGVSHNRDLIRGVLTGKSEFPSQSCNLQRVRLPLGSRLLDCVKKSGVHGLHVRNFFTKTFVLALELPG